MKEPVFNPGGIAALIVIVVTIAFCFWYGTYVRAWIDSGSWGLLALAGLAPFVLGYFVGDERDRADYHKAFNWLARCFGARSRADVHSDQSHLESGRLHRVDRLSLDDGSQEPKAPEHIDRDRFRAQ